VSYDIYVNYDSCSECGSSLREGSDGRNYTSNMSGAWDAAGARLRDWDGKTVAECRPLLEKAIAAIEADPEAYRKYEPSNGWGTVERMLIFLCGIARDFEEHPDGYVGVSA
jgi:hypothetical protein